VAFSRPRLTPEGAQKRAKVVELRAKRWSFAEIGAEVGLTGQRCGQLYRQTLAEIPMRNVDEHRAEAGELADKAVKDLLTIAMDVKAGLRNRIDAWLAIARWEEHRARLLGTLAPLRTEIMTLGGIDAEIARLEVELRSTSE
jgi:hypothetical protein